VIQDEEAALRYLRDNFRTVKAPGYDKVPFTLLSVRQWPEPYMDIVHTVSEDETLVVRSFSGGSDALFSSSNVVWRREGPFVDAVRALEELPAPDQPLAPRLTRWAVVDLPTGLLIPGTGCYRI
jgi:hypothetical protein